MTLQRIEVGLVSADESLAEFYAATFEMERLPVTESRSGTLHRLLAAGAGIKVMVPAQPPAIAELVEPFLAATGLRYLTLYAGDLDGVIERAIARGGSRQHGPMEIRPGVRLVILRDPDGNTIEVVESEEN